jgi:hypothetical protein
MGLDSAMARPKRWLFYMERHPRTAACCMIALGTLLGGFDLSRLLRSRSRLPDGDWIMAISAGAVVGIGILAVAGLCWRLVSRWPGWAPHVASLILALAFVATHPRFRSDAIRDVRGVYSVIAVDVVFMAILGFTAMGRWRTPEAGHRRPIEA